MLRLGTIKTYDTPFGSWRQTKISDNRKRSNAEFFQVLQPAAYCKTHLSREVADLLTFDTSRVLTLIGHFSYSSEYEYCEHWQVPYLHNLCRKKKKNIWIILLRGDRIFQQFTKLINHLGRRKKSVRNEDTRVIIILRSRTSMDVTHDVCVVYKCNLCTSYIAYVDLTQRYDYEVFTLSTSVLFAWRMPAHAHNYTTVVALTVVFSPLEDRDIAKLNVVNLRDLNLLWHIFGNFPGDKFLKFQRVSKRVVNKTVVSQLVILLL